MPLDTASGHVAARHGQALTRIHANAVGRVTAHAVVAPRQEQLCGRQIAGVAADHAACLRAQGQATIRLAKWQ